MGSTHTHYIIMYADKVVSVVGCFGAEVWPLQRLFVEPAKADGL